MRGLLCIQGLDGVQRPGHALLVRLQRAEGLIEPAVDGWLAGRNRLNSNAARAPDGERRKLEGSTPRPTRAQTRAYVRSMMQSRSDWIMVRCRRPRRSPLAWAPSAAALATAGRPAPACPGPLVIRVAFSCWWGRRHTGRREHGVRREDVGRLEFISGHPAAHLREARYAAQAPALRGALQPHAVARVAHGLAVEANHNIANLQCLGKSGPGAGVEACRRGGKGERRGVSILLLERAGLS